MICGGTSLILVEYVADREPYRIAFGRLRQGERTLFAKTIDGRHGGDRPSVAVAVLDENGAPLYGALPPSTRKKAERVLRGGTPAFLEEEGVFLDPVFPEEKLLILGGGYVGRAVAFQAARLDFRITVADDREEFSAAGRFPPGVETLCGNYTEILRNFPFRLGHLRGDGHARPPHRPRMRARGSHAHIPLRRVHRERAQGKAAEGAAQSDGFLQEKIDGLHAPIGLAIKAETPAELAIAILAEIVAVRRHAATGAAVRLPRSEIDLGGDPAPAAHPALQDREHLVDHVAVAAEAAHAGGVDGVVPQPARHPSTVVPAVPPRDARDVA